MENKINNSTIIPRSQYIESTQKEIKILDQITHHITSDDKFSFDIRTVNSTLNQSNDYWNDKGYINNVEIRSAIKNTDGLIIKEFVGKTTKKGHYSPQVETAFSPNSGRPQTYTLEVIATKYFDES